MEIVFTKNSLKYLKYWKKQKNKEILLRIESILNDIIKNPFEGIGNPEPLKYQLSGYCSRRITKEHHLIYTIKDGKAIIATVLRFHYELFSIT